MHRASLYIVLVWITLICEFVASYLNHTLMIRLQIVVGNVCVSRPAVLCLKAMLSVTRT